MTEVFRQGNAREFRAGTTVTEQGIRADETSFEQSANSKKRLVYIALSVL